MSSLTIQALENAALDLQHTAEFATSTAFTTTDRLGRTKKTIAGKDNDINVSANGILASSTAQAAAAVAARTAIDHKYRGALAADPATRTDGTANVVGDEYYDATANLLKRWNGTAPWQASDLNTANYAAPEGAVLVGTIALGTGAVPRTVHAKLRDSVTPQDFGADPLGVLDSGPALQRWLDFMVLNPMRLYQCVGVFKTSVALVANFSPPAICTVQWDCRITSTIPTLADVLTFSNSPYLHFTGYLQVAGNGGTSFSTRKNRDAVVINNCTRFSYDTIRCEYMLRHGLHIAGTTSQPSGKYLQSWYCGSSPIANSTKLATTIAAIGAKTSTSGSTTQSQQISIPLTLPEYIDAVAWFIKIGTSLYKIKAINSPTSLEIYPWLDNAVVAGAAVDFIGGAGYFSVGGDTSCGRISTLDSLVCGVGLQSLSLYPANIGNYVSQSNGATLVLGADIGAAMTTCVIDYLYSEVDVFGVVMASLSASQLRIGGTLTFPVSRSFRMAPRLTDGTFSAAFQSLGPGFSYESDLGRIRGSSQIVRGGEYSNASVHVGAGSVASYAFNNNSQLITLADPTEVNLITGLRAIDVAVFGSGAAQQPTGTVTLTPPATHTINGGAAGASVTFTGLSKPLALRCIWIGGVAWRVTTDIFPKSASQANSVAATVPELVTDFNALLTKLRTAGLLA